MLIGVLITPLISSFVDTSKPDESSAVFSIVSFFTEGFDITIPLPLLPDPHLKINFLDLILPEKLFDYVITCLNAYTFIPDYLSIPLFLIMCISFIYVVITLIPTMSGS
jgi:hypothetical protein